MESKSNKKIAFYIGGLGKGGAERVICNLAEYFYTEGYRVYMVTKLRDEDEYELRPEITRIIADITPDEETGKRIGNLEARINKLKKIWMEIKPDVIVSFIRKNNLMAIASASSLKIPVVVSVRSAPARELAGRGMKQLSFFMFRKAKGIVLQTNEARDFFPAYLKKKAIVLPNSINLSFLEARENDDINVVSRKKQIITVGRIDSNKNQRMLVDAFSEISGAYPEWSLELFGDGEGKEDLALHVKALGMSDRVHFHGAVSNVAERMKEASIFVLPSKIEGMPNALIEAMVMGMACISTDCPCGGPRDLIDGNNGLLIEVDDKDALVKALVRLIDDEKLREKLSAKASKIVDRLHPDVVNLSWKQYIEGIINK